MDCWDVNFPRLGQGEAKYLELLFFEEKIYRELIGVDGNKALSPVVTWPKSLIEQLNTEFGLIIQMR